MKTKYQWASAHHQHVRPFARTACASEQHHKPSFSSRRKPCQTFESAASRKDWTLAAQREILLHTSWRRTEQWQAPLTPERVDAHLHSTAGEQPLTSRWERTQCTGLKPPSSLPALHCFICSDPDNSAKVTPVSTENDNPLPDHHFQVCAVRMLCCSIWPTTSTSGFCWRRTQHGGRSRCVGVCVCFHDLLSQTPTSPWRQSDSHDQNTYSRSMTLNNGQRAVPEPMSLSKRMYW